MKDGCKLVQTPAPHRNIWLLSVMKLSLLVRPMDEELCPGRASRNIRLVGYGLPKNSLVDDLLLAFMGCDARDTTDPNGGAHLLRLDLDYCCRRKLCGKRWTG